MFFFVETVWKEMFQMIDRTVQNKCTGENIGPYNHTVPNKDHTYGKFGWKKIIVHVQLFSTQD